MLHVQVHKAGRLSREEEIQDVQITLAGAINTDQEMSAVGRIYEEDANALFMALKHLPGGTLHQLLIKLLNDKACGLVIQW